MRRLELRYCCTGTNRKCIEEHYPNLQHLTIAGINKIEESISLCRSNIAELVHLNPQLQSLKIGGDLMNVAFIRSISEHLQNI